MYTDYLPQVEKLTDEQAGQLLKAIMRHACERDPGDLDPVTDMVFSFIKQHMERDAEHYQKVCERRRDAAKQMHANAGKSKQKHANAGDNDNVNDNDNDNDNENDNENDNDVLAALASISIPAPKRKTKFSNFPERTYTNFDELERLLLNAD